MLTVVLGSGVVLLATFFGGVVGFAYGLISFPLLLFVGVPLDQVVASNLLIALCTRVLVLVRRHRDVNWRRVAFMISGSIPGMLAGMLVLNYLSAVTIQRSAGVFIVAAVGILAYRQRGKAPVVAASHAHPPLEFGTGTLGGFLGVTTSMNGVPPALLLTGSRVGARGIVADLAVYFIIGNLITLATLGLGGRLPISEIAPLLAFWIPVGLAGTATGLAIGPRLPTALFRNLALVLISIAGVVCIAGTG